MKGKWTEDKLRYEKNRKRKGECSKDKKEEKERKMKEKNHYWPKVRDRKLLDF